MQEKRYAVWLGKGAPQALGSGFRIITAKVGRKWAYVRPHRYSQRKRYHVRVWRRMRPVEYVGQSLGELSAALQGKT